MPPLVSVLITVYNREKYLGAAIESLLAQTFSDYELIIVDDRSQDRSVEIARRYEKDPRVRVYENDHNLGDYPNRNRAASFAQGKYLKYVDADDLIYPHCLELMVEAMEAFPEAGFGVSRAMPGVIAPAQLSSTDAYRDHFFGSGVFSVGPLDTIIRRSAFEQMGGFDSRRNTGDFHGWLSLTQRGPVAIMAPGLVWWRHHIEQESVLLSSKDPLLKAEFAGRYFRFALEALDRADCPLPAHEKESARKRQLQGYVRSILSALKLRQFQLASALVRESGQSRLSLARALLALPKRADLIPALSPAAPLRAKTCRQLRPSGSANPGSLGKGAAPLASVLIPAFNAEAHLPEAIESVLAQRFTDWELIIVDDASTDRTAEIARSYADGNRIRFYRNERNLGKWPNHNRCAELARGKYLKFLHADDLLYPHYLEDLTACWERYPQAGLGLNVVSSFPVGACLQPLETFRHDFFVSPILVHSPSLFAVKRKIFREVGGFHSDFVPVERHFLLTVAACAPAVLASPGQVWLRRVHRWGIGLKEKYPMGLSEGLLWIADIVKESKCPLPPAEKTIVLRHLRLGYAKRVLQHLRNTRWRIFMAALSQIRCSPATLRLAFGQPSTEAHRIREELLASVPSIVGSRPGNTA